MSRRSQVIQQRKALEAPITNSLLAASGRPMQLGLEHLPELLISQGAPGGYKIKTSADPAIVRVVATCGPLEIPLDFSPADTRRLGQRLLDAADLLDPPISVEEPPVMCNAEAEALLQEYIAKADKKPLPPWKTEADCRAGAKSLEPAIPAWTEEDEAALQAAAKAHDSEPYMSDFDAI